MVDVDWPLPSSVEHAGTAGFRDARFLHAIVSPSRPLVQAFIAGFAGAGTSAEPSRR